MKKNLFSWMVMAAMLLMASCTSDELVNEQSGDYVTASFTVGTPEGMNSRTVGDGTTVDEVACAVFNADGVEMKDLRQYLSISGKKATYSIRLVKGQAYHVAFFAYKSNGTKGYSNYYDVRDMENIKAIGEDLSDLSNLEGRDAFTQELAIPATATMNAINQDITLKRPFAQLNIGSTDEDWNAAIAAGIKVAKTQVSVTNVYTAFNAKTSKVAGESTTLTFNMNTIPANRGESEEKLMVKDTPYKYLALNYLLVGDRNEEKSLTDVEFVWESTDGKTNNPTTKFHNVPVQRNWRTNIIGSILTNPAQFNIVIDDKFDGEYIVNGTVEEIEYLNGVYYVSNAAQLRTVAEKITSREITAGTIELSNDIDLENEAWAPVNLWDPESSETIVFDGKGHKIMNLNISEAGSNAGFIGTIAKDVTIKDLTFENVTINQTGSFAGAVIGYQYGDVTLDNVDVNNVTIVSTGIRVGGLVGSSFVHDGATLAVKNCDVTGANLTAIHNVAGLVGTLHNYDDLTDKWTLSNNTVTGCTFVVTSTSSSNGKYASAFAVEGANYPHTYAESNAYFTGNTESNNTFIVPFAGSSISNLSELKSFAHAVNSGKTFEGETITLEADIDLKGEEWTPIGTSTNTFKGSFDGNDHTISNLKVTSDKGAQGLIGFAGGTLSVTNLTINNAEVDSENAAVGAVVGKADGAKITFSNIKVTGVVKLHAKYGQVGAVLGNNPNGSVYASDIVVDVEEGSYVSTEGNMGDYYDYVGGVFGQIWGATFKDITSNIDVITDYGLGAGGISGGAKGTWENISCSGNVTVLYKDKAVWYSNTKEDGNSYGEVKWYQGAGKIIGYHGGVTYTNCTSTGTLTYGEDGATSNDMYFFNSAGEKVVDSRFGCSRWKNDNTVTIND